MKICIIGNHSYTLWQFRRELICALLEHAQVTAAMPFLGHEEDFKALGCRCVEVPVDRRGTNPYADWRLYTRYVSLLKAEKPDLVLLYSIKPNVYGGFACRRLGIPFFAHVQGLGSAFYRPELRRGVIWLHQQALKTARGVFFENRRDAQYFVRSGIVLQENACVLHGAGVNLQRFAPMPYPDETQGIRFLFVGRIMKEKGVEELFEAASALKQRCGARVTFDFAGFFEENYKARLARLVHDGVIHFHGFRQDTRPLYAAAHCVVLPSYHEGMSNVLLEGAACARALITTDTAGCREAVKPGESGFLCRRADADSLYRCLRDFTELDAQVRRRMGEAGRRHMEMHFDRREVVNRTLAVLGLHLEE